MKSGPKPAPAALAQTVRTDAALPCDLIETVPDAPAWCTETDRQLWRSVCETLIARQHLTSGDLMAVESLVLAWGNVRLAREQGDLSKVNRFLLTVKSLLRELGLTPGSRDRVPQTPGMLTEPADAPGDDLAAFKGTIPMKKEAS